MLGIYVRKLGFGEITSSGKFPDWACLEKVDTNSSGFGVF